LTFGGAEEIRKLPHIFQVLELGAERPGMVGKEQILCQTVYICIFKGLSWLMREWLTSLMRTQCLYSGQVVREEGGGPSETPPSIATTLPYLALRRSGESATPRSFLLRETVVVVFPRDLARLGIGHF
jgi:hypothetical protein